MKKLYPVLIEVGTKDEADEGIRTELPGDDELRDRLRDTLCDQTKHDGQIGWRVTDVVN